MTFDAEHLIVSQVGVHGHPVNEWWVDKVSTVVLATVELENNNGTWFRHIAEIVLAVIGRKLLCTLKPTFRDQ